MLSGGLLVGARLLREPSLDTERNRIMKRSLVALLLTAILVAACAGTTASIPAGDPYRFNPGQADPAVPIGGKVSVIAKGDSATAERIGGLCARVAHDLGKLTNKETRYVVLGHLQRGGTPTSFDRVLATRFGGKAIECVVSGDFDKMVALRSPDIVTVPLAEIVGKQRRVPPDSDVVRTARALGISFGDTAPGVG
jgi:6-phosphofructokinase